jgi:hypothetical protein
MIVLNVHSVSFQLTARDTGYAFVACVWVAQRSEFEVQVAERGGVGKEKKWRGLVE